VYVFEETLHWLQSTWLFEMGRCQLGISPIRVKLWVTYISVVDIGGYKSFARCCTAHRVRDLLSLYQEGVSGEGVALGLAVRPKGLIECGIFNN